MDASPINENKWISIVNNASAINENNRIIVKYGCQSDK